jgi:shikimate kinase
MQGIRANIHGAISIVNAIATGKGATLGIDPTVEAIFEEKAGTGISLEFDQRQASSKLVTRTIEKIIPKNQLEKTKLQVSIRSEIPTGYGLKSSSAISTVVALACSKLFKPKVTDFQILRAGIDASIETNVSITGAFDVACACYFGGIVVTDNFKRRIVRSEKAPTNLKVIVFVPKSRKRGNVKALKNLVNVFDNAWNFAKNRDYWNAMILNGYATSSILDSNPKIISELIQNGAIGASVSGNGPAIAAVSKKNNVSKIKKVFDSFEGHTSICNVNNKKAEVHVL